jgi:hypothetical protein
MSPDKTKADERPITTKLHNSEAVLPIKTTSFTNQFAWWLTTWLSTFDQSHKSAPVSQNPFV